MPSQLPALVPKGLSYEDLEDAHAIYGALAPRTRKLYLGYLQRYRDAGFELGSCRERRNRASWVWMGPEGKLAGIWGADGGKRGGSDLWY